MSELIKEVTPLTAGLIWLVADEKNPTNGHHSEIDYLLDGLLTAFKPETKSTTSQLLIGKNFGKDFYVFIVKEIVPSEVQSFVSLVEKRMGPESDLLVLDDHSASGRLQPLLGSIQSRLRFL